MAKVKYKEALIRLQEISKILESEIQDIDELSKLVKESAQLIKQCKKQLRETSEEITTTLDKLDEPLA